MTDGQPSDGEDRRSDLAVMDANEYKQKRRLRRILDAQENVEDVANRSYEMFTAGEIGERGKNIVLLRAVKQYIREAWNLLVAYDDQLQEEQHGDSYAWNPYLDGPPVNEDGDRLGDPLGKIDMRGESPVYFWGLEDYLHADPLYDDVWQEEVQTRHGPDEYEQCSETRTVPEDVSWNAYLLTRRFLAEEKDMEVQFENMDDSLPVWGFTELTDTENYAEADSDTSDSTDLEVV